MLNDGSGLPVKVRAPGYTQVSGDFVTALGTLDVNQTPPLMTSHMSAVQKCGP
jgi:hypothetical protein